MLRVVGACLLSQGASAAPVERHSAVSVLQLRLHHKRTVYSQRSARGAIEDKRAAHYGSIHSAFRSPEVNRCTGDPGKVALYFHSMMT